MDIEEIRRRKNELQEVIASLLQKFQDITGTTIDSVRIRNADYLGGDYRIREVVLSVEIPDQ